MNINTYPYLKASNIPKIFSTIFKALSMKVHPKVEISVILVNKSGK